MKNLQHKVCIFCVETLKTCPAVSEHIFYVSANVCLLLGVFRCIFNERAAASEKILTTASEKNVQLLFLRIMSTLRNVLK